MPRTEEQVGEIEESIDRVINEAMRELTVSSGATWGNLIANPRTTALSETDRQLLLIARIEGLERAVRLIAGRLDSRER
jgi:hypothetical protein